MLTEEQLEVHRKACQEILDNKIFGVTLTGGEPLAVIEQLLPELQLLTKNGVDLTVNTNLALLTPKMAKLLNSVNIHSVLTSLMSSNEVINDGIAQRKGAFARTVRGIRLARSLGFTVGVNMVVTQKNINTIYETGKLTYELGAETFSATKAAKPTNCPDFTEYSITVQQLQHMFLELIRVRDDFGIKVDSLEHYPACVFPNTETRTAFGGRNCSAAKTGSTIGFDGAIRPCSHCPISYGNVATDGMQQSWKNMECWRDDSLIPAVCITSCGEAPNNCGGGCRIESMNAGRALDGVDPFCSQTKPVTERELDEVIVLPMDCAVLLSRDVRFRKEDFGYIAYRGRNNKWVSMDPSLHDLLNTSLTGKVIRVSDVVEIYQAPLDSALETLNILKHLELVTVI
jgi:radical SAM protein with 4Fe4S-binding SPASM domain